MPAEEGQAPSHRLKARACRDGGSILGCWCCRNGRGGQGRELQRDAPGPAFPGPSAPWPASSHHPTQGVGAPGAAPATRPGAARTGLTGRAVPWTWVAAPSGRLGLWDCCCGLGALTSSVGWRRAAGRRGSLSAAEDTGIWEVPGVGVGSFSLACRGQRRGASRPCTGACGVGCESRSLA